MENYGEIFDRKFVENMEKEKIYPLFVKYFGNPIMTKLKNVNNHSMYCCKIQSMLGIEQRYLIIFKKIDKKEAGTKEYLSEINWECLQTRTLPEDYKIDIHTYIPERIPGLNKKIKLQEKTENLYIYEVENLPIIVSLLPKTKNIDYLNHGNVVNALETYQTIINWKE